MNNKRNKNHNTTQEHKLNLNKKNHDTDKQYLTE